MKLYNLGNITFWTKTGLRRKNIKKILYKILNYNFQSLLTDSDHLPIFIKTVTEPNMGPLAQLTNTGLWWKKTQYLL